MQDDLTTYERIASNRKTTKVMSECNLPLTDHRVLVERLLTCAAWAPFHRSCDRDHRNEELAASGQPTGIEPWRFHILDSAESRRLRSIAQSMEAAGKIPAMLASALATIIATWLPNSPQSSVTSTAVSANTNIWPADQVIDSPLSIDSESFEPTVENVEHIAAASAAVQSLLLAATAAGLRNYWSSGGVLRSPTILRLLGIPATQRVLGIIFLFPATLPDSSLVQAVGSKLRESRGPLEAWSRWVALDHPESRGDFANCKVNEAYSGQ